MSKIKRKWDLLSDDERKTIINNTMYYFQKERDEDIWMISAGDFLDFFLKEAAELIYNKAIEDSKVLMREKMLDFEVDLDMKKL